MKTQTPFHAFFYITRLEESITFYRDKLGLPLRQTTPNTFTIDFYGHGISFEYNENFLELSKWFTCSKDDIDNRQYVPSMHWGVNLDSLAAFENILNQCIKHNIEFIVPATFYNKDTDHEQALFFIKDPTGYIIEMRYMCKSFVLSELKQWDQRSEGHKRAAIS